MTRRDGAVCLEDSMKIPRPGTVLSRRGARQSETGPMNSGTGTGTGPAAGR
ncbi:MAG: DNA-binding response regulator, partial [Micrococcus luteus]